MIDCLLIGYNDVDFGAYVDMVSARGRDDGVWQDLRLSFVEYQGQPYRALDALTLFRREATGNPAEVYHNADFLWPVITVLGSYLGRHGFSFEYVNLFQQERDRAAALLRTGEVRTVAITTTLYVSPVPLVEVVDFVRSHAPDTMIIVGGPYIFNLAAEARTSRWEAVLRRLGADVYVLSSEGEQTLGRVLSVVRDGGELSDVPNLVYRKGDELIRTPEKLESNSLAENMVDYGLFRVDAFNAFITIRTAKSCPFSCAFCGFPQRAGKYTYLDLSHVEAELDRVAELANVNTITFIDDTFNVPKVRFREICQLMIDKGYGFHWNCYYRSDHGDRRTIELMKAAGCEGVFLGVESGSDEQLARMNKTARRADYLSALGDFRDLGISTYASLIIGFPGETASTVAETESLLAEGRPDFFRTQLWYCDPVTPIWERRAEFGIEGRGFDWRHATMSADEACDHIERIFLSVDEPIWMPQFGFEQWSTFYLQRRGFTMAQVKEFLVAFNDVVRDQLRRPGREDPVLMARLRAASTGP